MIQADKNKSEILDFMVQRYGEFVLYKPRFSTRTLILWLAPAVLLLMGAIVMWRSSVRGLKAPALTPDADALARAQRILDEDK